MKRSLAFRIGMATLGVMFLFAALPLESHAAKINMRLSHGSPVPEEPMYTTAVLIQELMEESVGDKVNFQVFPSCQIGCEARAIQDLQQGVIQIASVAVNNASVFSPALAVFDLPYIFKSAEEFNALIDNHWEDLNEKIVEESGLYVICWYVQGFRVISNSKHPIKNIDDLKDVKIRVPPNPIMVATFKAWGGQPVPMGWDETFNAVQQKVVDGQENPYSSLVANKMYEVQRYVADVHYKMWVGPMLVKKEWLDNLPADVREALLRAGREVTMRNREEITQLDENAILLLKEKGMQIDALEDEDVWIERAMSTWPQFYEMIGDLSILDQMMDTLGRARPQ